MSKVSNAQWSRRSLVNILVLVTFVSLMASAILYFYQSTPNIRLATLQSLAQQFSASVTNAHWQWQAEGRPEMIMLIHYEGTMDENQQLVESGRKPVSMGINGWPKVNESSDGCGRLWRNMLNIPLDVEGFRIYPEFLPEQANNPTVKCRFRLSTGPYFEYDMSNGRVSGVVS